MLDDSKIILRLLDDVVIMNWQSNSVLDFFVVTSFLEELYFSLTIDSPENAFYLFFVLKIHEFVQKPLKGEAYFQNLCVTSF